MTAEQVLQHYASQLRAHGWSSESRTAVEGIAVETYRLTDAAVAEWRGALLVHAPRDSDQRLLSLQLMRPGR